MTKYDFRVRRQLFQKRGSANRFQNFDELEKKFSARKRAANVMRLLMILIAMIFLIGMLVLTAKADEKAYESPVTKGQPEMKILASKEKL